MWLARFIVRHRRYIQYANSVALNNSIGEKTTELLEAMTASTILKAVIVLVLCYLAWRVINLIWFYFTEYLVLWRISRGGSEKRRSMSAKMRLHVYVCPTEMMDESSVAELFKFLNNHLDSSVNIQAFQKVLLSYTFAVLFRERRDGSLRGLFVLSLDRCKKGEKCYAVLRPGLSFFEKEYRGGPYVYYVFSYFRIKEFFLHPFTQFYVFGKVFSYRSYAVLTHNLAHVYPSYNHDTPEDIKSIINSFADKVKLPGEVYNSDKFVLERETVTMKGFVSEAGRANMSDPNIRFFVERNPDWSKGHQLLTISSVDFTDILRVIYRTFVRTINGRRESRNYRKPVLMKRISFQSEFAGLFSKRLLQECDVGGGDHHNLKDLDDDNLEDLNEVL